MPLTEESLSAIKSAILLAAIPFGFLLPNGIAKRVWGETLSWTGFMIAAVPFILSALLVYWFYLRLPYPSRYGHGRNLLGSHGIVRTHPRDMLAMGILGVGGGAFTMIMLFLFELCRKRIM
jgi:hypothetical protein